MFSPEEIEQTNAKTLLNASNAIAHDLKLCTVQQLEKFFRTFPGDLRLCDIEDAQAMIADFKAYNQKKARGG